ncbi:P-loop containing nucleoside triphosphate hydrolase protein [Coniophora puteana RWD-64-598 SS2]|uniref:P-loop containing nucleoside triphosphate hydrolase protein n=1 Tax=Coniophora puteana (strain RWD-64-598) TaxID=741705 RepID=A0A5M3MGM3_CONPW|nr:P-loop containing nucleoside triphosphate hydrolase protein [Coniophora puteana RWD-64-598 SS2]EIW78372.1 P-loop containing nucleoside triphosphate hydrolase protein [Coniophora puteana RWD-64-598 SS2]
MQAVLPFLPAPPSWFPGHMSRFTKQLPSLLSRTDVLLEIRDSRLPLTSINNNLEGAIHKWRAERGYNPNTHPDPSVAPAPEASLSSYGGHVCEHIVVLNKRDLVPEWGIEPFRRAMARRFPGQTIVSASLNKTREIKSLSQMLVNIAKRNPHATEMNVLVVGMPNVGKSTLLNSLRHQGIAGRTAKALQTSSQPGHTRTVSSRLKLSEEPLIYSYDSPGVMLPFLGRGQHGAERGVKLALIAGIKEGLYDIESLVAYLLYRLNILNPVEPAYLRLLPPGSPPVNNADEFIDLLATRLNMRVRGGLADTPRAAKWFVEWWRSEGGLAAAASAPLHLRLPASTASNADAGSAIRRGWGFDIEWTEDTSVSAPAAPSKRTSEKFAKAVQQRMEECIDAFVGATAAEEEAGMGVSTTQERKRALAEKKAKAAARTRARLSSRKT